LPVACCFACTCFLVLQPRRWRQYFWLKCQWTSAGLHSVTSQSILPFR
jgi:hypothetical protein